MKSKNAIAFILKKISVSLLASLIILSISCNKDQLDPAGGNNPTGSESSSSSADSSELIVNGDFSVGLDPWSLWTAPAATATGDATGGEFVASISSAGADWEVQLALDGLALDQGNSYTLDFEGRALSGSKIITVVFRLGSDPYTVYNQQSFTLSTVMSGYQMTFTMANASDPAAQLLVYLGSDTTGVALDNFSLINNGSASSSSSSSTSSGSSSSSSGTALNYNGDFSLGMDGWATWTYTGGGRTADFNVVAGEMAVTSINGGGVASWISLVNAPVSLVQGSTYTISFDARSTVTRVISVGPRMGSDPYTAWTTREKVITSTMQTYSFTYTHTAASDPNAQIIFFLGASDDPVYIDNVTVVAGSSIPGGGPTLRLLTMGDSISQGNIYGAGTYRKCLFYELTDLGYNINMIGSMGTLAGSNPFDGGPDADAGWDQDHECYWGYTTTQLETIITTQIGNYDFDIVIIHLGTNDPGAGAIQNLKDIIDILRSDNPNVVIILAKIIAPDFDSFMLENYANDIPSVVTEKDTPQSPVILVDQWTTLTRGSGDYVDGLHPSQAGAAKMAAKYLAAIRAYYSY